MSKQSSSVDAFDDDFIDDGNFDSDVEEVSLLKSTPLDARRRLEELMAERSLEKELREFNFDF